MPCTQTSSDNIDVISIFNQHEKLPIHNFRYNYFNGVTNKTIKIDVYDISFEILNDSVLSERVYRDIQIKKEYIEAEVKQLSAIMKLDIYEH